MTFFYDLNKKLSDLAARQSLNEGKKPDFLDLDKDGNKKEPMKTAAKEIDEAGGMPVTPKQKSFAKLAPPADKITFADKIAGAKKEVDEMLGDVAAEAMKNALGGGKKVVADEAEDNNPFTNWKKPRAEKPAVGTITRGSKHDVEEIPGGRRVTRRVDPAGISVGADDDAPASGEKRGRGRPKGKGAGKSIGAKGPSGKSKLMTKESVSEDDIEVIERLMDTAFAEGNKALGNALQDALQRIQGDQDEDQYDDDKQVNEKAVSKKQQKFMGMVHAAQKGEKPASKEVAKVAKDMGKKDAKDFAATKHKGLPEKKAKKKEVEETTVAGSVATAPSSGKANSMFGKGVYEGALKESFDKKLNAVLNETMSINASTDSEGHQSLNISATDDDATNLAQVLKLAGLGQSEGYGEVCPSCGSAQCGCDQVEEDLANSPEPEYSDTDTMVNTLSGGLNGRKETGQTTVPVVNRDPARGSFGPVAESTESKLWEIYNRYQSK